MSWVQSPPGASFFCGIHKKKMLERREDAVGHSCHTFREIFPVFTGKCKKEWSFLGSLGVGREMERIYMEISFDA